MNSSHQLQTNPQQEEQQPKKNNRWLYYLLGAGVLGLIALFLVIYLFAGSDTKPPTTNTTNETSTSTTTIPSQLPGSSKGYIFVIIGIVVVVLITFVYLHKTGRIQFNPSDIIKPIFPDKALEVFTRNIVRRNRMTYYIDEEGKICFPTPQDFVIHKWMPYKKYDDELLGVEFEVSSGVNKGFAVAILPLNKGEDAILNGYYRLDWNTSFPTFRYNPRLYPIVGPKDTQQRILQAVIEGTAELDSDKQKILQQYAAQMPQSGQGIEAPMSRDEIVELSPESGGSDRSFEPGRRTRRYRQKYGY